MRKVTCEKCDEEIEHCNMRTHLLYDCPEAETECMYCGEKMLRKLMGGQHYNSDTERWEYTGHHEVCPKLYVGCEFYNQGCFKNLRREDLDEHHVKFARKHAEMVSKEFKSIRAGKYWTAAPCINWVIPGHVLRRISTRFSPESQRVKVGNYETFLKLVVTQTGSVEARVCVEDPDQTPPWVDRITIRLNQSIWAEDALEMRDAQKMEKDNGEDRVYSVGGQLTLYDSSSDNDGDWRRREVVVDDLEYESSGRCLITAQYRLKGPEEVRLGCLL